MGADRKSDYEPSKNFCSSKTDAARGLWADEWMLLHKLMLLDLRSVRDIVWIVMQFGKYGIRLLNLRLSLVESVYLVFGVSDFQNAGS